MTTHNEAGIAAFQHQITVFTTDDLAEIYCGLRPGPPGAAGQPGVLCAWGVAMPLPRFLRERETARGFELGDFEHPWMCRLALNPGPWVRYCALVAEDHSYTFKTTEQRYRRELDHLPYGPKGALVS